jgi:hypothetical protein
METTNTIDTYYWGTVEDVAAEIDANVFEYAKDSNRGMTDEQIGKLLIGIYASGSIDGMLDMPYTEADRESFACIGIKLVRV